MKTTAIFRIFFALLVLLGLAGCGGAGDNAAAAAKFQQRADIGTQSANEA